MEQKNLQSFINYCSRCMCITDNCDKCNEGIKRILINIQSGARERD